MCGIAGLIDFGGRPVAEETLKNMTDRIAYRGPDAEGFWSEGPVGFGHRRLAVIDLSGGQQPMVSADGRYVITFNGEIFNFLILREELEKSGVRFRTRSDTEVLLALFEKKGPSALDRLIGQFAFAIWDRKDRRLFLARDRYGKKPLLYAKFGSKFYFASEAKAILADRPGWPAICAQGLYNTMYFGFCPPPLTMFEGILHLPPSHYAWVDAEGRMTQKRYWSVDFSKKINVSLSDAKEQLAAVMQDAVKLRLIADVPLGIFLSGGVDSSTILAFAAQVPGAKLRTFCVVTEKLKDEPDPIVARQVAEHFGTQHEEIVLKTLDAKEGLSLMAEMTWHQEFPYRQGSVSLLHYNLCRGTRQRVTVALGGDAGDEIFGGYPNYARVRQFGFLRRMLGAPWPYLSGSRTFGGGGFLGYPDEKIIPTFYRAEFSPLLDRLDSKILSAIDPAAPSLMQEQTFRDVRPATFLDGWTATELFLNNYHGVSWLSDINGLAHGLEIRAPFLDHRIIELLASLPDQFRVSLCGKTKVLQRALIEDRVPPIVIRRKKVGLGWYNPVFVFRFWEPHLHKLVFPNGRLDPLMKEFYSEESVRGFWEDWRRDPSNFVKTHHLWLIVSLAFFCRIFLGGQSPLEAASLEN